jgi:hypothetical protein
MTPSVELRLINNNANTNGASDGVHSEQKPLTTMEVDPSTMGLFATREIPNCQIVGHITGKQLKLRERERERERERD